MSGSSIGSPREPRLSRRLAAADAAKTAQPGASPASPAEAAPAAGAPAAGAPTLTDRIMERYDPEFAHQVKADLDGSGATSQTRDASETLLVANYIRFLADDALLSQPRVDDGKHPLLPHRGRHLLSLTDAGAIDRKIRETFDIIKSHNPEFKEYTERRAAPAERSLFESSEDGLKVLTIKIEGAKRAADQLGYALVEEMNLFKALEGHFNREAALGAETPANEADLRDVKNQIKATKQQLKAAEAKTKELATLAERLGRDLSDEGRTQLMAAQRRRGVFARGRERPRTAFGRDPRTTTAVSAAGKQSEVQRGKGFFRRGIDETKHSGLTDDEGEVSRTVPRQLAYAASRARAQAQMQAAKSAQSVRAAVRHEMASGYQRLPAEAGVSAARTAFSILNRQIIEERGPSVMLGIGAAARPGIVQLKASAALLEIINQDIPDNPFENLKPKPTDLEIANIRAVFASKGRPPELVKLLSSLPDDDRTLVRGAKLENLFLAIAISVARETDAEIFQGSSEELLRKSPAATMKQLEISLPDRFKNTLVGLLKEPRAGRPALAVDIARIAQKTIAGEGTSSQLISDLYGEGGIANFALVAELGQVTWAITDGAIRMSLDEANSADVVDLLNAFTHLQQLTLRFEGAGSSSSFRFNTQEEAAIRNMAHSLRLALGTLIAGSSHGATTALSRGFEAKGVANMRKLFTRTGTQLAATLDAFSTPNQIGAKAREWWTAVTNDGDFNALLLAVGSFLGLGASIATIVASAGAAVPAVAGASAAAMAIAHQVSSHAKDISGYLTTAQKQVATLAAATADASKLGGAIATGVAVRAESQIHGAAHDEHRTRTAPAARPRVADSDVGLAQPARGAASAPPRLGSSSGAGPAAAAAGSDVGDTATVAGQAAPRSGGGPVNVALSPIPGQLHDTVTINPLRRGDDLE